MALVEIEMKPFSGPVDLSQAAVIIIDMQIDFLMPCGFGELLGNNVKKLHTAIEPCKSVLNAAREAEILVIHTREGHRADLRDLHPHKRQRLGCHKQVIGTEGPNGRVLVRGEKGHDIIPELYPRSGEPVVDKPGKGSFYGTDLEVILRSQGISTLLVMGVTTEVCVHTTVREANDRGFHCIVVSDACASFFDDFHATALRMIIAQGGIFGSVTDSLSVAKAMNQAVKMKSESSKASTSDTA